MFVLRAVGGRQCFVGSAFTLLGDSAALVPTVYGRLIIQQVISSQKLILLTKEELRCLKHVLFQITFPVWFSARSRENKAFSFSPNRNLWKF